jgi:thiamine-monophosphate kinase
VALGEFELIERYFRQPAEELRRLRGDAPLGIGDDAALLVPPAGRQLVAALDTLVEGRHFPSGSPPRSIGHRALAVNLSDLAAMGADPAWFLLALTMPAAEESFLHEFAGGMLELASRHGIALVGGDSTAGPLCVSVQALGFVDPDMALRRAGGSPGDLLYVSGTPGDAAAGLSLAVGEGTAAGLDAAGRQYLLDRFHFPAPRIALGRLLRGLASACIDVSDGMAADAGKLAQASGCGAVIELERLPLSGPLRAFAGDAGAHRLALAGGDDYELCFSIASGLASTLTGRLREAGCPVSCIGTLVEGEGVRLIEHGRPAALDVAGYDHFSVA